jgi:hypothetical protein
MAQLKVAISSGDFFVISLTYHILLPILKTPKVAFLLLK